MGDWPDPAAMPAGLCRNCTVALPQLLPAFCPSCGQSTRIQAPRLGEFVQQFGGAYLATEGALWRTLKLLLIRPGELTRLYLAGRRKHYVLPLRLFLTISLVSLLLLRLTIHPDVDLDASAAKARPATIQIFGSRAGLRDGIFYCDDLPQWLCHRIQRRVDLDPLAMQREMATLGDRFMASLGAASFVMLPAFAMWMKLAYWNRRLRYTEHLVFALHLHAFWFAAMILSLPTIVWLQVPVLVAMPVYALLAMRRVYGGRARWRWLRAALVSLLQGATLAVAMTGIGIWVFLT